MTALIEGAKKALGRSTDDLGARVDGLTRAVGAARGRLDDRLLDDASAVADRAGERLRLSADHTVVALAGATGSGKSSTFNALSGLDLAAIGVRRPTTSWTMSCTWGAEGAEELLEWLGVPKRHQVTRDSMLDARADESELHGLVLLDLPDHDSTEVSHHIAVDRLVKLTDVLVWVLDPQKYADAAIHDRYLKPLASHKDVMLVVLNHIDTVPEDRRQALLDDLAGLLRADGLDGVPVIATSARHGEGIPELKRALQARVEAKQATKTRLTAEITDAARALEQVNGTAKPADVARARKNELVDAFADAAGVPTVVHAVEKATRIRANRATGWPVTAWLSKLRPDPLKRLHLDLGSRGKELTADARTSIPQASLVQRARVDTAVRAVAEDAAAELTPAWAAAIRSASVSQLPDLNDALDRAVTETDLGVTRTPAWWRLVRIVQWALIVTALLGVLWLGGLAVLGFLQIPAPETPYYQGIPVPTLMLVGGVAVGIVLGFFFRLLAGLSARAKARSVDRRLRAAIGEVTDRLVVEPIEAEVLAYRTARDGIVAALK